MCRPTVGSSSTYRVGVKVRALGLALASSVTSLMRWASPPERVGDLLAEGEVAEADVLQQLQGVVDVGMVCEELHRLVDAHGEHVADGFVAISAR